MDKREEIEDFATAPGEVLRENIEALGMTQSELAKRSGLTTKTINQIVQGKEPVSHSTALALEKVLRVPAHFWLNLETRYREHLARVAERERMVQSTAWARRFNYSVMARFEFVKTTRKAEEKVEELLKFFGVASQDQWESIYCEMDLALSFRTTKNPTATEKKRADLSAWLRAGERQATKAETKSYDPDRFAAILQEMRELTTDSADVFSDKIREKCAEAGVVYLLIREMPGLGISGVTRWFHGRPVIQQSLLFKTNDQFWFTFFHESKHVLQGIKTKIFLEGESANHENQKREEEANRFAAEILIPGREWKRFVNEGRFSERDVKSFSEEVKIHPGITVGRMLREGVLNYDQPQAYLRQKLVWKKD